MSEKDKFRVVKNNVKGKTVTSVPNIPEPIRKRYLENRKPLEESMSVFMQEKTNVNMTKLMEALSKSVVLIPAKVADVPNNPGKKTPVPFWIRVAKKPQDENEEIAEEDKNGLMLPVFTGEDKLPKDPNTNKLVFPGHMYAPFDEAVRISTTQKAKGIVVNHGTDNLMFNEKFFDAYTNFRNMQKNTNAAAQGAQGAQGAKIPNGTKAVKMTPQQMNVLFRRTTECRNIPAEVFKDRAAFMTQLDDERETFMTSLYKKIYPANVPCPYDEGNFSVMMLNIDENTVVASIELPAQNLAPKTAVAMYIIWNPQNDDMHYYLIEKGEQGENDVLCSVDEKLKHEELMTAPAEGSEISAILELMREEEEEE